MPKLVSAVVCFFVFIIITCGAQTAISADSISGFPLKIGLLADSQITTYNGSRVALYRSKTIDAFVNVAIRPPALEELSPQMLKYALDQLYNEKVDVILYLGDGANSGGEDELNVLFSTLRGSRHNHNSVPIFMVIGNHDYLGVGNTSNMVVRRRLINRPGKPKNKPLTKYDVVTRISAFNHESTLLANKNLTSGCFAYRDNFDSLLALKNHNNGLYLAGLVGYTEQNRPAVEIFLADTSDYMYATKPRVPNSVEGYGAKGSISSSNHISNDDNTQMTCLKRFSDEAGSKAEYRIIAAHYPLQDLHMFYKGDWWNTYIKKNLLSWTLNNGNNYWVSGHTHIDMGKVVDTMKPYKVGPNNESRFDCINIGSTTDKHAHVAVLGRKDKEYVEFPGNGGLFYKIIPMFDPAANESLYSDIKKDIEAIRKGSQAHS
ncbi:MAG: metallophosphoesterase [Nitrospirae bacterium]|nr:metallophosphoesterase [Nitrospirota bacterium]